MGVLLVTVTASYIVYFPQANHKLTWLILLIKLSLISSLFSEQPRLWRIKLNGSLSDGWLTTQFLKIFIHHNNDSIATTKQK